MTANFILAIRCRKSRRTLARLSRGPRLGSRLLPAFCLLLSVPFSLPAQAPANPDEYQLKAAFIFHFAQLVDWPPDLLTPPTRPLTLCTTAENPSVDFLESAIQGKSIDSHPLQVRRLRPNDSPEGCHLLFIAGHDKKRVASALFRLNNAPILTVGESDDFVEQGGMIGFCLQDKKIRFNINLKVAQRSNLKISSRLLLLAKTVVGGRPG